jgi:hypothetical protein
MLSVHYPLISELTNGIYMKRGLNIMPSEVTMPLCVFISHKGYENFWCHLTQCSKDLWEVCSFHYGKTFIECKTT